MLQFLKKSYEEFKRVKWPSKKEATRLTTYVIGVSLFVGLFVAGIDYTFQFLLDVFLR